MRSPAEGSNMKPVMLDQKIESRTEREEERCFRGIPIQKFCDMINHQAKLRHENEGTDEEYPI